MLLNLPSFRSLLQQDKASVYWDIDQKFLDSTQHDAGYFIRQHQKSWPHFKAQPFKWVSNHYTKSKNISVIGTPKNIGQVKYVGALAATVVYGKQTPKYSLGFRE